ncbi:MAG: TRAP transporter fused permease subunit [bacterium]|nr:TRAP transporter fused permease subunit [bacterium]
MNEPAKDSENITSGKSGTSPVVYYAAIVIAIFHIWANTFGNLSDLWRNSLHFGMLGSLAFLIFEKNKDRISIYPNNSSLLYSVIVFSSCLYLIFFENALHARNEVPVLFDLVFAALAVAISLELSRRTSGYVMPVLALFFLTYVLIWGKFIPGIFNFRGLPLSRVLYRLYFTDEGMFGMIATISSTYVFMFILFAAFLLRSGGADFIIKLSTFITRRIQGGAGLVAVLASGLMGTISGSAVANTVSTGAITIPLMKKSGFKPRFAAAVETASSTGGQLMPPIMGAGAFIMSQWTQIPYPKIIAAALLPALLYFISIAAFVFFEARKEKIPYGKTDSDEKLIQIMREGSHFLLPILVLIGMLIKGYTPTFTAGISIIAVIAASWLNKNSGMKLNDISDALFLGTKNMIITGLLLITAGIIIGLINMTGLSITFSQLVVQWSGNSVIVALIFITAASLFLGMGLPVTAAYIMISILTVPALEQMGISVLTAHMIIFWLSQDSNVTPPVCLAAFAASTIAGSKPMETGIASWKLAKGLYIIPVLFAYTSLIDGGWGERVLISLFAVIGLAAFSSVSAGYLVNRLTGIQKISLLISIPLLLWPENLMLNLTGLFAAALIMFFNFRTGKE